MKFSRNYLYFRRHFGDLVKKHGGRMVVISGGRLVGSCGPDRSKDLARMVDHVRKARPNEVPFVSPVPSRRELQHGLLL